MLPSRSPAAQKAQHQVSAVWRVVGASQAAGVNFRLGIWPLSFHGSQQHLPSAIVRQVPPCTELRGLGGLSWSSFPCRPQSRGRVAVKIPPELTGNAFGQEARGFSQAAAQQKGSVGAEGRCRAQDRCRVRTGCCSWTEAVGKGGSCPGELPLEHVPFCCILFWRGREEKGSGRLGGTKRVKAPGLFNSAQ